MVRSAQVVRSGHIRFEHVRLVQDQVRSGQVRTSKDEVKSDQGLLSSGKDQFRLGQAMSCNISSAQFNNTSGYVMLGLFIVMGLGQARSRSGHLQSGQIRSGHVKLRSGQFGTYQVKTVSDQDRSSLVRKVEG